MMDNYKAFISYRRSSGYWLARLIYDLLVRDGYRVFFDETNNENGSLNKILKHGIDRSDFFILVVSEDCFEESNGNPISKSNFWKEVEYALENDKTMILVLTADATMPISTYHIKNNSVKKGVERLNKQHDRYIKFRLDEGLKPYNKLKERMHGLDIKSLEVDCMVYRRVGDAIYNNPTVLQLREGKYEQFFDSQNNDKRASYVIVSNGDKHRIFEKVGVVSKNKAKNIELPHGENELLFVSKDNPSDQKIDTINVRDGLLYTVDLLDMKQKQEKEEREGVRSFKIGNVEFNMIYVKGGKFKMGYWGNDMSALLQGEPKRNVEVKGFWIGETVVTQSLYEAVMNKSPEITEEDRNNGCKEGDDYPVVKVSWNDAREFVRQLSKIIGHKYKLPRKFRLPTTEEWEYAARGGEKSRGYIYAGSSIIGDVAWYNVNSDNELHTVKEKAPNELGLYDMSGNVWEWTRSKYENDNEIHTLQNDSRIVEGDGSVLNENEEEMLRTTRGGSFNHDAICSMVSSRSGHKVFSNYDLGFRIVMERLLP